MAYIAFQTPANGRFVGRGTIVVPVVNQITLANGTENTPYSATFTATGTGPFVWSASLALPGGMTLDEAGLFSGVPRASGTYLVGVTVYDSAVGVAKGAVFTWTVAAAPDRRWTRRTRTPSSWTRVERTQ